MDVYRIYSLTEGEAERAILNYIENRYNVPDTQGRVTFRNQRRTYDLGDLRVEVEYEVPNAGS